MPNFDGTGPAGQGAMTGGGRGWCMVEIANLRLPLAGRGVNSIARGGYAFCGRRRGRGGRFGQFAPGRSFPANTSEEA